MVKECDWEVFIKELKAVKLILQKSGYEYEKSANNWS